MPISRAWIWEQQGAIASMFIAKTNLHFSHAKYIDFPVRRKSACSVWKCQLGAGISRSPPLLPHGWDAEFRQCWKQSPPLLLQAGRWDMGGPSCTKPQQMLSVFYSSPLQKKIKYLNSQFPSKADPSYRNSSEMKKPVEKLFWWLFSRGSV